MLNDNELKEIARRCAKTKPKSYYAEPFEPHEWVIDAMREAAKTQCTGLLDIWDDKNNEHYVEGSFSDAMEALRAQSWIASKGDDHG